MTPGFVSKRVLADRLDEVDRMLDEIRSLPLDNRDAFFEDSRNRWTTDSCLRRALEGLLDVGRHVLAKGYGQGVSEYKEIATQLEDRGVISAEDALLLRTMAGYRNRLVHYYHDVTASELYAIASERLDDIERVASAFHRWALEHPEMIDEDI